MLADEVRWYAEWRAANAGSADSRIYELVRRGEQALAANRPSLRGTCLIHADLGPNNMTTMGSSFSGIIDWDYACIRAPEWELGKVIARFLVDLVLISKQERIDVLRLLLARYCAFTNTSVQEVHAAPLVFALTETLYQIIVRNRTEAKWAILVELDAINTKRLANHPGRAMPAMTEKRS